jgi:hypothetical protein
VTPAASASEQDPPARNRARERRSFDVARRHHGRTILGSDVVLLSILDRAIELMLFLRFYFCRTKPNGRSPTKSQRRRRFLLSLAGDKPDSRESYWLGHKAPSEVFSEMTAGEATFGPADSGAGMTTLKRPRRRLTLAKTYQRRH